MIYLVDLVYKIRLSNDLLNDFISEKRKNDAELYRGDKIM